MTMPTLKVTVEYELDRQDMARALAQQWVMVEGDGQWPRTPGEFPETRVKALEWVENYLGAFGDYPTDDPPADVLHLALLTVNELFPELRP